MGPHVHLPRTVFLGDHRRPNVTRTPTSRDDGIKGAEGEIRTPEAVTATGSQGRRLDQTRLPQHGVRMKSSQLDKGCGPEGFINVLRVSSDGIDMTEGPMIAVVGGSSVDDRTYLVAKEVGRLLAEAGAVVINGGYSGVMEAASLGASEAGGTVIDILQGTDRHEGNPHLTYAIASGMGKGRNTIIAMTCDAMIAIDGGYGTLSEVAQALNHGRPVVALGSWDLDRTGKVEKDLFLRVDTPEDAVVFIKARQDGSLY